MEAFSDGVLAIIITIMVLEMKVPHGADVTVLGPLIPVFLSYGKPYYLRVGIQVGNDTSCEAVIQLGKSETVALFQAKATKKTPTVRNRTRVARIRENHMVIRE